MLMRTFWRGAKTDDEYRKVLKKRCIGIGFMMAAGVAALIAAAALMKTGKGENDDFLSGVYLGIGTGILVSGIIFLYRVRKMFKNPELLRQRRLKESDESSVLLNQKALYRCIYCTPGSRIFQHGSVLDDLDDRYGIFPYLLDLP